jgi:rod shape-determining protein MreD
MTSLILKWLAAFAAALVLQTSFVPVISIARVGPDLPLVVLFFFCIRHGMTLGICVGFFLGLGLDLYSPSLLGQNALAATMAGAFAGFFNERTMRTDPLVKSALLLVVFIVHDSIFLAVQSLKLDGPVSAVFGGLLFHCLPRALYSIAVAGLWYARDFLPKRLAKR